MADLSAVLPEDRQRLVEAIPTILSFCAEQRQEEETLANKYLGSTPKAARKDEVIKAWAESPRAAAAAATAAAAAAAPPQDATAAAAPPPDATAG